MFKRIIIATEMSQAAFDLIEHVKGLKKYGTDTILLIQCTGSEEIPTVSKGYFTSVIQKNLDDQQNILEAEGFQVETRIACGLAKNEVNRIAFEEDVSMIVTGAQKHTLSSEIFFGGLAYDIIHHSHKPVLIIRLNDGDKNRSSNDDIGSHIIFPTDFSINADWAFEYLKLMVLNGAGKITLMHVQDKERLSAYAPDQIKEFDQIDLERLKNLAIQLEEIGEAEIVSELGHGSPTVEILRRIRETDASLVVMGSQGRGYVEELFIGSVSQNIARHADASVLLIPAHGE